jgi:prepilin-type N-terminal cleavage/methylation domain-containing protein
MTRTQTRTRAGVTLIELIVVMALIVIIASLGYLAMGAFKERNNVADSADRITGILLIAKMRAKKDGVPTGVRMQLTAYQNAASVTGFDWMCNTFQYVQQPDPYAVGQCTLANSGTAGPTQAHFQITRVVGGRVQHLPVNFNQGAVRVAAGDLLELYGGALHRINGITTTATFSVLTVDGPAAGGSNLPIVSITGVPGAVPNYRIIRQPRVLNGEEDIVLPLNVGIDFQAGGALAALSNVPTPTVKPANGNSTGYYDILYAPSGAVVGQGTPNGQICLWVRDVTMTPNADLQGGFGVIVAVQTRSGFISSNQIGPAQDPYFYTRDERASGL